MAYKFINNYETKLTAQATAAETSITVASASGISVSIGDTWRLTIQNANATQFELIDVTAVSGNVLTVLRAREGTTAQAWPIDSVVICGVTKAQLESFRDRSDLIPISNGGTNSSTAPQARQALGLGTAATANLTTSFDDNTIGRVLKVNDWGIGSTCKIRLTPTTVDDQKYKGCFFFSTDNVSQLGSFYAHGIRVARDPAGSYADLLLGYGAGLRPWAVVTRHVYNNGAAVEQTLYSSMNPVVFTTADAATAGRLVTVSSTGEFKSKGFTIDSNGFYKSASPIVRLYADHIELNDDASHQDITFERVAVGHYLVKGSSGFATDGWWLNVPVDSNGNKIVASTHNTLADGTLEIKTFKRKFDIETATIVPDLGQPIDIPANNMGEQRWIDIRLAELPVEIPEEIE